MHEHPAHSLLSPRKRAHWNGSGSRVSMKLAHEIRKQLQVKPDSVFGLPTGRTPVGAYRILSTWSMNKQLDWAHAKCFGLDEYVDSEEADSYRVFLREQLLQHTNLPKKSQFNPLQSKNYDELIAKHGGLDLTVLGIGVNGHIAFNEPGTPIESCTHSVVLDESTRAANSSLFADPNLVPTKAVTMGLKTILESRRIILVAIGVKKRHILTEAFRGPITTDLPASLLQTHGDVTVLTDFAW